MLHCLIYVLYFRMIKLYLFLDFNKNGRQNVKNQSLSADNITTEARVMTQF